MTRDELLRRIDKLLTERGISAARASELAVGNPYFIRNMRRYPDIKIDVGKLSRLANILGVPVAYFADQEVKEGDLLLRTRRRDEQIWRLAEQLSEEALRRERGPRAAERKRLLVDLLYDVIAERVADGASLSDPEFTKMVQALLRRAIIANLLK